MADLYALAIELDRVRFGSLTFLAAGERLRITGDYKYDGRSSTQFDDAKQLNKSWLGRMQSRVVAPIQSQAKGTSSFEPTPT